MNGKELKAIVANCDTPLGGDQFWRKLAERTGTTFEQIVEIQSKLQSEVNQDDFWDKFAEQITKSPT